LPGNYLSGKIGVNIVKSLYLCGLVEKRVVGKGVFDIDIFKLADGKHIFAFDFDSSFFALFEESVVANGNGLVRVELDKTPALMTLTFHLDGEIELICDRSLDTFMLPLHEVNEIRVKYGDHWEELSDDLLLIPADTQRLDVGQLVYEFITLAIPMKKLHPRFAGAEEEGLVFTSAENEASDTAIDPRWNELKKLKK